MIVEVVLRKGTGRPSPVQALCYPGGSLEEANTKAQASCLCDAGPRMRISTGITMHDLCLHTRTPIHVRGGRKAAKICDTSWAAATRDQVRREINTSPLGSTEYRTHLAYGAYPCLRIEMVLSTLDPRLKIYTSPARCAFRLSAEFSA